MVGLSMAITIALCIGSFVWIYAQVEPVIGDFVDAATVGPTTVSQDTHEGEPDEEATAAPQDEETPEPEAETPEADSNVVEPSDNEPKPTATREVEFKVTHIVSAEVPINLRPGPGVGSGDPVGNSLPPGTELQYLDKTQPSQDPNADGDTAWMNFRLEDGREGWIRQIDVSSVNAGQ